MNSRERGGHVPVSGVHSQSWVESLLEDFTLVQRGVLLTPLGLKGNSLTLIPSGKLVFFTKTLHLTERGPSVKAGEPWGMLGLV